jgi:hypothetical protein
VWTGHIRLMPDFIIIGAQKCGTTSLYKYLTQHPCVMRSYAKEVHFFDNNFEKGITWYRAYFPSFFYTYSLERIRGQDCITGEATPYYIFHPLVPKRIAETIPQVKLIMMLRNPVDRAYSHYSHEVRRGNETLSFEEAIKREGERLSGEVSRIQLDRGYYSFNHQHYSYLARGIYVDQLEAWMDLFPRGQILIMRSEDFYSDPQETLRQAIAFLDLPSWEPKEYGRFNIGKYPNMNPAIRNHLLDYFAPHNQRLSEFLGVDIDWDR